MSSNPLLARVLARARALPKKRVPDELERELRRADASEDPEVHVEAARRCERDAPDDPALALSWWARAAGAGHPRALLELEERIARDAFAGSDEERLRLLRAAVEGRAPPASAADPQRWVDAQIVAWRELGRRETGGSGVALPAEEAVACLREAAAHGDGPAAATLGDRCLSGEGAAQDAAAALGWYRVAAERGEPWGALRAGLLLAAGWGAPRNSAEAFSAFERVLEAPDPPRLVLAQAHAWLGRLVQQGYAPPRYALTAKQHFAQGSPWSVLFQVPISWGDDRSIIEEALPKLLELEAALREDSRAGGIAGDELLLLHAETAEFAGRLLVARAADPAPSAARQRRALQRRAWASYAELAKRDARGQHELHMRTQDGPERAELLRAAAEAGWPPAMAALSAALASSSPVEARSWLERAANAGSSWAALKLGPSWFPAPEPERLTADEQVREALRAAEWGDTGPLRQSGDVCRDRGEREEAIRCYALAASAGDVVAQVEWALLHLGRREADHLTRRAHAALESIVFSTHASGEPSSDLQERRARARACTTFAVLCLERRTHFDKVDKSHALSWLQVAAQWGDPRASVALGELHWRGELVAVDPSAASVAFTRASAEGDLGGAWRQALLLAEGWGVVRDERMAVHVLRHHLDLPSRGGPTGEADRALHDLLVARLATPSTPNEARDLLQRATEQGYPRAKK